MLTHSRVSRTRLMTGAAAVLGLVATGLVATASGTRAAAAVTTTIEAATGVRIAPEPPVPPMPPVPMGKAVKRIVVVKDGKAETFDGAAAERYAQTDAVPAPPVPPVAPRAPTPPVAPVAPVVNITSADCGPDKGTRSYVVTTRVDGRDQTVICTDRITAAAMAGKMTEADQHDIQRKAMTAALASLRTTRASILANTAIPTDDRKEAVTDIDDSIKEMEGEIADIGKD